MALSRPAAIYPLTAKVRHVQGTVVVHALIGKDGRIHELQVVSSPDPALSTAAMDAVRNWTFRPFLLEGDPVEVETTINVNFALRR